jgi:hypothetical protein
LHYAMDAQRRPGRTALPLNPFAIFAKKLCKPLCRGYSAIGGLTYAGEVETQPSFPITLRAHDIKVAVIILAVLLEV